MYLWRPRPSFTRARLKLPSTTSFSGLPHEQRHAKGSPRTSLHAVHTIMKPHDFTTSAILRDDYIRVPEIQMVMLVSLKGKAAVVTAAGRGIGRAIALQLAGAGAHIVVNSLHKESCGRVADEIAKQGGKALAIPGDVGQKAERERMIE